MTRWRARSLMQDDAAAVIGADDLLRFPECDESADRSACGSSGSNSMISRIVPPLNRRHRIVEHFLSLVDHDDVIAELFGVRHDVRGEEDRGAARVLLEHHLPQAARADGIEPAERLVEDQQIGLMDDGGEELDLLLRAFREILAALALGVREAHAREAARDARRAISASGTPLSRAMNVRNGPTRILR